MVPDNNDELWEDDSDDEGDAGDMSAFVKLQRRGLPSFSIRGPVHLPLRLGGNLTLLALGHIEYVNPLYHNEKFIFPVGYKATRVAATPASGGKEVEHTMEILKGAGTCGAIFRCGRITGFA